MEYDQIVSIPEEHIYTTDENVDACQNVSIEHGTPYSMEIKRPKSLSNKTARCEKLKKRLQRKTQKFNALADDGDHFYTAVETCITTEDGVVELQARLNNISLSLVSLYHCQLHNLYVAPCYCAIA